MRSHYIPWKGPLACSAGGRGGAAWQGALQRRLLASSLLQDLYLYIAVLNLPYRDNERDRAPGETWVSQVPVQSKVNKTITKSKAGMRESKNVPYLFEFSACLSLRQDGISENAPFSSFPSSIHFNPANFY